MSIQITPEQEARINELARQTGRDTTEVLGDVIDSYFEELARINARRIVATTRSRVGR